VLLLAVQLQVQAEGVKGYVGAHAHSVPDARAVVQQPHFLRWSPSFVWPVEAPLEGTLLQAVFQHEPASGFAEVHALGAWLRVQPPREVGRENRGAAAIDHSAKSHGHHAAHQELTTLQKFENEQIEVVEGKELVQAGHWREPLLPARALAAVRRGRRARRGHAGLLVFGCLYLGGETILSRFMKTQNETQLKSARRTLIGAPVCICLRTGAKIC